MKICNSFLFVFLILLMGGCATTVPVAVIGQDGRVLTGTSTASWEAGSFEVRDRKIKCAGSYDPWQTSTTISMRVVCSDGRKGIVRAIRDTAVSGSGTVVLNDGYRAEFIFGGAAANF